MDAVKQTWRSRVVTTAIVWALLAAGCYLLGHVVQGDWHLLPVIAFWIAVFMAVIQFPYHLYKHIRLQHRRRRYGNNPPLTKGL